MKKNTIIVAIVLASVACVEPQELKIDENCTTEEIEVIERSIEKINEAASDDVFAVKKIAKIDYDAPMSDSIVCVRDTEEALTRWPTLDGLVGQKNASNVILRTDLLTLNDLESTAMHEFIHLMGVENEDHTNDPKDVFFKHWIPDSPVELSERDVKLIRDSMLY